MTTQQTRSVQDFITGFRNRDTDAALAAVADDVAVTVYPLQLADTGRSVIATVLDDLARAFPDLLLTVRSVLELGPVVVAEIKIEGTQAADYVGVINQEKHLDVDSAWRFTVTGEQITAIDVYWCQNQLYRRLAVKRTDHVAIV
ncbi:hypothetical protein GPOL_c08400 [Gordonia polyisoprenivorans VH2]|uniref:SnoaL-like domain-containing protein n=1 Tax=Gordonia polyisoprenivorans (strain DSM 44266 / VH2) TaxID=1112204 RepID=H6MYM8_GORPV|nr:ester cyclase [Gordonia polyisoprenivorans]AFA71906.1 hypothetical protein GPOL_c08400 [Gordonia polyisoprenivorans VH2]WCB38284.1 ester cyclase [Gordonia polyisoprenivorans]